MAPPGKHVMSIFVQYAPYNLNGGWTDAKREAFGDAVIDTLARYAPNIKSLILHRQVLTPADIERITGLSEGNIFQGELALHQLFFLRPAAQWAKYRTPIRGYWQCGAGTHPGGGIMGASGRLAALRDRGQRERARLSMVRRRSSSARAPNGLVAAAALGKRRATRARRRERADAIGGQRATDRVRARLSRAAAAPTPAGFRRRVARGPRPRRRDVGDAERLGRASRGDGAVPALADAIATPRRTSFDAHSSRDAERWSRSSQRLGKLAGFLGALYQLPPPDIDATVVRATRCRCSALGRKFRALGRADMTELLRVLPMSVQDSLDDEFESADRSRPPSARAAFATFGRDRARAARRSCCCTICVGAPIGSVRARSWWRDGPDAFIDAVAEVAARERGVAIRTGRRASRASSCATTP